MKYTYRNQGFTLVQLITVLAVASITLTFAAGNWGAATERVNATRVQNNLKDAFGTARASAITKRRVITLCPLDGSNECVARWNEPVSIFIDPDSTQSLLQDDHLLYVVDLSGNGFLKASSAGPAERRYFQYNPDGSARGTIGNLTWCPPSKDAARAIQLILNFGGRIRWARDFNDDGVAEDAQGQALSCP